MKNSLAQLILALLTINPVIGDDIVKDTDDRKLIGDVLFFKDGKFSVRSDKDGTIYKIPVEKIKHIEFAQEKIEEEPEASQPKRTTPFPYKNVSIKRSSISLAVIGEITNSSNKSFSSAVFDVSIYSDDDALLDTTTMYVRPFGYGATKSFKVNFFNVSQSVSKYKIAFSRGH